MRGQTAKRRQDREVARHAASTRLERDRITGPQRTRRVAVRFPDPRTPGRVVLEADGLTKGYGGPDVFEDVTFAVERGERMLVLGLNGAGKTSLMRILAGQTEADAGTWSLRPRRLRGLLRPGARGHHAPGAR